MIGKNSLVLTAENTLKKLQHEHEAYLEEEKARSL